MTEPRRCAWAGTDPRMIRYHDEEWGTPVHDDRRLFEFLILEGAQAGLSWSTILNKREAYRKAFRAFDPAAVARFSPARVEKLMGDAGIVRNRQKVEAAITNAGAVLELRSTGGLDSLFWSFAPERHERPADTSLIPATSPESVALAKALKRAGFVFVGPTTMYAAMQACGVVDDHVAGCHRAGGR